jgi:hypothetical protein
VSQLEPYLPDVDVQAIQAKLYDAYPRLIEWNTDVVTTRIAPPWHGQLPDGTTGTTKHAVLQFILISDHPRPMQRSKGIRHGTVASAWQQAFEQAMADEGHYVIGGSMGPLAQIFAGVLQKHIEEMESLASIINDAVIDPSKPKSALDAL